MCIRRSLLFTDFDIGISLEVLELVYSRSFETDWQLTYKRVISYVGWMTCTLVYNNSLTLCQPKTLTLDCVLVQVGFVAYM